MMIQQFLTRLALLLLLSINGGLSRTSSQTFFVATNEVNISYPIRIRFNLNAESDNGFSAINLYYGTTGKSCMANSAIQRMEVDFENSAEISWAWEYNDRGYLAPGTEVWWYWELIDDTGKVFETPQKQIVIEDDRYSWKTIGNAQLTVNWFEGNYAFGTDMFQISEDALSRMKNNAGLSLERKIKIFIYPDTAYFLNDIDSLPDWTGGVAFSDYALIIISVSPEGDNAWAGEVIPHEVAHVITNSLTFNCKGATIPLWLNEGISVFNENSLSTEDADQVLRALKSNQLPQLISLKSEFAVNSNRASLDYAYSGQIVRYLIDTYGEEKLKNLLENIAAGKKFEDSLFEVYGLTTRLLDYEYREFNGYPPLDWNLSNESKDNQETSTPIPTLELYNPFQATVTDTLLPQSTPTYTSTREDKHKTVVSTPTLGETEVVDNEDLQHGKNWVVMGIIGTGFVGIGIFVLCVLKKSRH